MHTYTPAPPAPHCHVRPHRSEALELLGSLAPGLASASAANPSSDAAASSAQHVAHAAYLRAALQAEQGQPEAALASARQALQLAEGQRDGGLGALCLAVIALLMSSRCAPLACIRACMRALSCENVRVRVVGVGVRAVRRWGRWRWVGWVAGYGAAPQVCCQGGGREPPPGKGSRGPRVAATAGSAQPPKHPKHASPPPLPFAPQPARPQLPACSTKPLPLPLPSALPPCAHTRMHARTRRQQHRAALSVLSAASPAASASAPAAVASEPGLEADVLLTRIRSKLHRALSDSPKALVTLAQCKRRLAQVGLAHPRPRPRAAPRMAPPAGAVGGRLRGGGGS